MTNAKSKGTYLRRTLKLSNKKSPQKDDTDEDMAKVSYARAVGSLAYNIGCMRPTFLLKGLLMLIGPSVFRHEGL